MLIDAFLVEKTMEKSKIVVFIKLESCSVLTDQVRALGESAFEILCLDFYYWLFHNNSLSCTFKYV